MDRVVRGDSKIGKAIQDYSKIDSQIKTLQNDKKAFNDYLLNGMNARDFNRLKLENEKSYTVLTRCKRTKISYNEDKLKKYLSKEAQSHIFRTEYEVNIIKVEDMIDKGIITKEVANQILDKREVYDETGVESAYQLGLIPKDVVNKCANIVTSFYLKLTTKLKNENK